MEKFITLDVSPVDAKIKLVQSDAFRRLVENEGARAAADQVAIAFRTEGAHYGEKWAPRKKGTDQRIGAADAKATAARAKAAKFRREAVEQDYAAVWLSGKKKERAAAKAEKARAKAKEWRGKARKAAADAVASTPILVSTGTLRKSFFAKDGAVATSVAYAVYHEFGTMHMDPRPVMPFDQEGNPRSPAVEKAVQRAMENMAQRVLGGK